jgi:hypothetical protein
VALEGLYFQLSELVEHLNEKYIEASGIGLFSKSGNQD